MLKELISFQVLRINTAHWATAKVITNGTRATLELRAGQDD